LLLIISVGEFPVAAVPQGKTILKGVAMKSANVASAGVPKLEAVGVKNGKFPTLKLKVRHNGSVVRTIEIPDPREKFVKAWDALNAAP
jgi:hypothetical protein